MADTSDPTQGDGLVGFKQLLPGATPATVHDKLAEVVSVRDFGAKGDGRTDDTAAIQAAIDSLNTNSGEILGGTIFFPVGHYNVTSGIKVCDLRITLQGAGRYATTVSFNPTSDQETLFTFDRGSVGVSWQCAIRDMALASSKDEGLTKTAIELKDTSNMIVKDLIIGPWTGNGESVGLRVQGREAGHIHNLHIQADCPLVIGKNDQNPYNDIDHFRFSDLYLLVTEGVQKPCVFIEDGVDLQNVCFDGFQAWVLGTYGLYWKDTQTTSVSLALTLHNVRTEQGTDPNGYSIYIERNAALQDLQVENMVADYTRKGFFFRNINRTTLRHVLHNGSDVALDIDKVAELSLEQVLMGTNSTVIMPNMQEKFALNRRSTHSPVPDTAYFIQSVGLLPSQAIHLFGTTHLWTFSGILHDDEQLTIPAGNNQGRKAGTIWVSGITGDGLVNVGGQVIDTAQETTLLSGTNNFGVGNIDGKLTVFHTSATTIFNRLGQKVELTVFVTWY